LSEPSKIGAWLKFVGFGLVLASFLTLDVLLLLWFAGVAEGWQWGAVAGGAVLLLVGALMFAIGKRWV
jgi:hypothetical protein